MNKILEKSLKHFPSSLVCPFACVRSHPSHTPSCLPARPSDEEMPDEGRVGRERLQGKNDLQLVQRLPYCSPTSMLMNNKSFQDERTNRQIWIIT